MSNCVACTDCRSAMSSLRFCDSELPPPLLLLPLPRGAPLSGGGVADEPDLGAGAGAAGGGGAGAGAGAVSASILETAASSAPERSPPSNAPLVLALVAATSVPPGAEGAFFLRSGGALLPRLGASGFAGGGERRARSTRGDDLSTVSTCPTPQPATPDQRQANQTNSTQVHVQSPACGNESSNPTRDALSEETAWSPGREG